MTLAKLASGLGMAALGLLVLATLACGGTAGRSTPTGQEPGAPTPGSPVKGTPGSDYRRLSGPIEIDGSSTVFPITEGVAEEFGRLTRGRVRVTVGISGTGGGFKKFCNGETDIANASRPIKGSEVDLCAARGIRYVELPVAFDGLTVVVNPGNDFVQCMTVKELHKLWSPEAEGKINRWSQVRPGWPDRPVRLYGPGVDSGSFDYFTEAVNGKAQSSRGDFTASEDDNLLVQGVAGDQTSLGYFGYAYYLENTARVKAVAVDPGTGCVLPTEETINNGTYAPLSRPLFIYVRQDAATKPQVREFVRYYLSAEGGKLTKEVGYIPLPPRVYPLVQDRFERGITGSVFGGHGPQKGTVEQVLSAPR